MTIKDLVFRTETEMKIFFVLINGGSMYRKEICKKVDLPRTTVYDNLINLSLRLCNNIPYVSKFIESPNGFKGRPKTFWFIPKGIKHLFAIEIKTLNNRRNPKEVDNK